MKKIKPTLGRPAPKKLVIDRQVVRVLTTELAQVIGAMPWCTRRASSTTIDTVIC